MMDVIRTLETQLNLLSEGAAAGYHGARAAAPTTGTWSQGDWVKNSSPSATGWFGFVCVTGGTPGTWKGFGEIEA
jgi:hypothetical protein